MRLRRNEKPEEQNPKTKQEFLNFLKYKKFSLNSPSYFVKHKKKYEFLKAYINAANLNNINFWKHT